LEQEPEKIQIILTSFNRTWLLRQAIESVLNQTCRNFHLYIMDDFSNNAKTHEILDEYAKHSKVVVYKGIIPKGIDRYSRTGYSIGINHALAMSSSPLITYLTCDDIYYPDRLERMIKHLDENPEYYIVYGKQLLVSINGVMKFRQRGIRVSGQVVERAACHVDHNSVMHRRICIDTVCREDGLLPWFEEVDYICGADAKLWERFNRHWPFHLVPGGPTDEHRFHEGSLQDIATRVARAAEKGISMRLDGSIVE